MQEGDYKEIVYDQIIKKRYNILEFQDFCLEKSNKSYESLPLDQLETMIANFTESNPLIKNVPSDLQELGPLEFAVKCQKLQPSELSEVSDLSVDIEILELGGKNFLKIKKTLFSLTTDPFGWTVYRKSSHFAWLVKALASSFPGIYIPPKPPKRYINSNPIKQRYFLKRLISDILENPLFRSSEFLVAFLKEEDYSAFEAFKKETKLMKKSFSLGQYRSLDGELKCNSYLNREKAKELKSFLVVTEAARRKIKRKTDGLLDKFKEISKDLNDLASAFEDLEEAQKKFPLVRYIQIPLNEEIYRAVKDTFKEWSEIEIQSVTRIQKNLNNFFKYAYREAGALIELMQKRDSIIKENEKKESKINKKKEKLFAKKNVNAWQLPEGENWEVLLNNKTLAFSKMLPTQSLELRDSKTEAAFCNRQLEIEVNRVFLKNQKIEMNQFDKIATDFRDKLSKLCDLWEKLLTIIEQYSDQS